ncbi:MAG: outer membrane protein assembly factor BamD [Saprospiraceae bacterium]
MKKWFFFPWLILVVVLFASACKSEFEKVRASGDTDLIYKKAFEYYEQEEYLRAQALFELIIPAYRGRPELEKVYFTYAYTYYKLSRFVMANYYFKNFSSTFPTSNLREEADFMAAFSNYQMSPTYRLDQTYTNKAIDEFQIFVNTYPNSERVKECNRLIDEMRLKLEKKAFEEGILYYNLRQYQAATVTFNNLLKDFPETNNAERVRFFIAKAGYQLAANSIFEKQEERYKNTVGYAKDYLEKFSDSDNSKEIQSIYDNSVKKLKSLTNGRYQDQGPRIGS